MSEKEIPSSCVRQTPRAGLCALGAVLQAKHFFAPIEARVQIHQKEILHQVIDKLKIRFITLLSGAAGLYLSDKVVRADPALQSCFGCSSCPDQPPSTACSSPAPLTMLSNCGAPARICFSSTV